jgi:hypothetical protein
MTHPYAPNCCALPASHEVHDWLTEERSYRITEAYAVAVSVRDQYPDEMIVPWIMEAAK